MNAFCLVVLPVFGVIGTIDQVLRGIVTSEAKSVGPEEEPRSRRVFAILVDSFPYALATNSELMPEASRLLHEASFARVNTVAEAVTSPAIWSAFTGRIDYRILDIMRNFGAGTDANSSLFSDLQDLKKTVFVYSDENSFKAFEPSITQLVRNDIWDDEDDASSYQDRQALAAAESFAAGRGDLLIYHVTYFDAFAHKFHSASAEYQEAARQVDQLIGKVAAKLPADQSFIVFGDHGHTAEGRHLPGLDVPTVFIGRGPVFEKGPRTDFHIRDMRFLFSQAAGINPSIKAYPAAGEKNFEVKSTYVLTALALCTLLSLLYGLWLSFAGAREEGQLSLRDRLCHGAAWASGLSLCLFAFYPDHLLTALALAGAAAWLRPGPLSLKGRRGALLLCASGLIMAVGYYFGSAVDRIETLDAAAPPATDRILMLTAFTVPTFAVLLRLAQRRQEAWKAAAWFVPTLLAIFVLWTLDLPLRDSLGVIAVLACGGVLGRTLGKAGSSRARLYVKTGLFILLFFGLAWFSCRWSLKNFKWQFIYQFLHPKIVEEEVLWLVPLIGVRYALLAGALKMLMFNPQDNELASQPLAKIFVSLVMLLGLLSLGSGFHYPEFQSYLNFLLLLGAFFCMGLGFVAVPVRRPS